MASTEEVFGRFAPVNPLDGLERLTQIADRHAAGYRIINPVTDETLVIVAIPTSLQGQELADWLDGYKANLLDQVWPSGEDKPELAHLQIDSREAFALIDEALVGDVNG